MAADTKEYDPQPKVFVGGLNFSTRGRALGEHFDRCAPIVSAEVISDPVTGSSRGYGFVEFETFKGMEKAIEELHNSTLDGYIIKVQRATKQRYSHGGRRDDGGGSGGGGGGYRGVPEGSRKERGYSITLTNLPQDCKWWVLKDLFREAGECTFTNVYPDGTGLCAFATIAECSRALKMFQGHLLNGRRIRMDPKDFDPQLADKPSSSSRPLEGGSGSGSSYHRSQEERHGERYREQYRERDRERDSRGADAAYQRGGGPSSPRGYSSRRDEPAGPARGGYRDDGGRDYAGGGSGGSSRGVDRGSGRDAGGSGGSWQQEQREHPTPASRSGREEGYREGRERDGGYGGGSREAEGGFRRPADREDRGTYPRDGGSSGSYGRREDYGSGPAAAAGGGYGAERGFQDREARPYGVGGGGSRPEAYGSGSYQQQQPAAAAAAAAAAGPGGSLPSRAYNGSSRYGGGVASLSRQPHGAGGSGGAGYGSSYGDGGGLDRGERDGYGYGSSQQGRHHGGGSSSYHENSGRGGGRHEGEGQGAARGGGGGPEQYHRGQGEYQRYDPRTYDSRR